MLEEVKTLQQMVSMNEFIIQLAEEANELAMVAIDLKNTFKVPDSNYYNILEDDLIEEIADVKLCIDIIGYNDIDKSERFDLPNYLRYELLDLLAYHCCGLSKTAIKLRRTLIGKANPTPVSKEEAERKLIDAIYVVKLCVDALGSYWDSDEVSRIYKEKAIRCINRMTK